LQELEAQQEGEKSNADAADGAEARKPEPPQQPTATTEEPAAAAATPGAASAAATGATTGATHVAEAVAASPAKSVAAESVATVDKPKSARDEVALKRFIATFGVQAKGPRPTSVAAARARLGSAPPSEGFRSLVVLSSLDPVVEQLLFAESPEDIKLTVEKLAVPKKAVLELVVMAKTSIKKLAAYIKAAESAAANPKGRKAASGASGSTGVVTNIWDLAATHGRAVPDHSMANFDKNTINYNEPFIVRFVPADPIFDNALVKQAVDAFTSKFEGSSVRATEGRAQRPVKNEVQVEMQGKLGA